MKCYKRLVYKQFVSGQSQVFVAHKDLSYLPKRFTHLYRALYAWRRAQKHIFYYRIYWINRPGRLLNFWTLRMGVYSRWALMRGWALIKFSPFSTSVVCIFWKKTVSGNNKSRRCNKASRFCKTLWRKLRLRGSLKLVLIPFLGGSGKGVGAYLSLSESGREVGWVVVGVETGLPPLISGSGWSSPH